jgi:hypothetical protein
LSIIWEKWILWLDACPIEIEDCWKSLLEIVCSRKEDVNFYLVGAYHCI